MTRWEEEVEERQQRESGAVQTRQTGTKNNVERSGQPALKLQEAIVPKHRGSLPSK